MLKGASLKQTTVCTNEVRTSGKVNVVVGCWLKKLCERRQSEGKVAVFLFYFYKNLISISLYALPAKWSFFPCSFASLNIFFFTRGEFTFSVLFIHLWKPNCRVDSSAEGLWPCLDLKKKEAWARLKVLKKLDVWQKVRCTLAHLHISASQVSHGNYFCSSVSILWF